MIYSKNTNLFLKLLDSENSIYKFYGICGLIKLKHSGTNGYLDKLLVSNAKVDIFINNKKPQSTLGYATLILIRDLPEWLTNKPNETFYKETENIIQKAYNSELSKINATYKDTLFKLIADKYPSGFASIKKELDVDESLENKSIEDKIKISKLLDTLESKKRDIFIPALLEENNNTILINTIKSIKDNDNRNISAKLYKIIYSNKPLEIINPAIEKYALLLKKDSVLEIQRYLKNQTNEFLVVNCLNQISKYGNMDLSYEYLKLFLSPSYGEKINEVALKTIIDTTFNEDPNNTLKTILFIINKGGLLPAHYAINFLYEKNLTYYTVQILTRFRKYESDDMKKLSLKYIEHFKLVDGLDIVNKLLLDGNQDISQYASKVLSNLQQ